MKLRVNRNRRAGALMAQALIYLTVVFVLLGAGYFAMHRSVRNSLALQRNADEISAALHAGECWRADIRSATASPVSNTGDGSAIMEFQTGRGRITYTSKPPLLIRQVSNATPVVLLRNVQASTMTPENRAGVTVWRWELELRPRKDKIKMRPLFTFLSVPAKGISP